QTKTCLSADRMLERTRKGDVSMRNHIFTVLTTVVLASMLNHFVMAQRLTGTIFTTDRDGNLVNGNIYESKCDVYLNGGPPPNASCSSAGLPDGDYFFQVTDPSGSALLSQDAITCRAFTVRNGLIVSTGWSQPSALSDCVAPAAGVGACASSSFIGFGP